MNNLDPAAGDLLRSPACVIDERDYATVHGTYRCASLMLSLRVRNEFVINLKESISEFDGDEPASPAELPPARADGGDERAPGG